MITTSSTSTPTVGSARTALIAVTRLLALPVCPMARPSGSAMASAMTRAMAENRMWAWSWLKIP